MTVRMDPRRLMYLPPPSSEVVTVAKTTGTDGDGAFRERAIPPATPCAGLLATREDAAATCWAHRMVRGPGRLQQERKRELGWTLAALGKFGSQCMAPHSLGAA